jgi:hypothetical protein
MHKRSLEAKWFRVEEQREVGGERGGRARVDQNDPRGEDTRAAFWKIARIGIIEKER